MNDDLLKIGLIAAAAYFLWPTLSGWLAGVTSAVSTALPVPTTTASPYSQASIQLCLGSGGEWDPNTNLCTCPPQAPNFNGQTCSVAGPIGVSGLRRNYRRAV